MLITEIREDDLTGPQIVRFLRDHLDYMYAVTPPESVHAFDLERLRAPALWLRIPRAVRRLPRRPEQCVHGETSTGRRRQRSRYTSFR